MRCWPMCLLSAGVRSDCGAACSDGCPGRCQCHRQLGGTVVVPCASSCICSTSELSCRCVASAVKCVAEGFHRSVIQSLRFDD